jgi:hypothetical protein
MAIGWMEKMKRTIKERNGEKKCEIKIKQNEKSS